MNRFWHLVLCRPLFHEFKKFAIRGNVIDLAVGVIVGAAFGKIVDSLVKDLLMPPFGLILGRVDFRGLYVVLDGKHYDSLDAARKANAPVFAYGNFLQEVVNFLIVSFAVFLLVRAINRSKEKPQGPPPSPETKSCPQCLSVIPLKARRCAFCTEIVEEIPGKA